MKNIIITARTKSGIDIPVSVSLPSMEATVNDIVVNLELGYSKSISFHPIHAPAIVGITAPSGITTVRIMLADGEVERVMDALRTLPITFTRVCEWESARVHTTSDGKHISLSHIPSMTIDPEYWDAEKIERKVLQERDNAEFSDSYELAKYLNAITAAIPKKEKKETTPLHPYMAALMEEALGGRVTNE